ncbi:MAG: VWA domain-containing protein, partial [Acidobacteriaceae bacterium]|nr:VWA domain-containing protein [Acidobacteriaceae bacterium]
MFEFLFKYPASVFSKGTFVLLGSWPKWILFCGIFGIGALFAFVMWRRGGRRLPSMGLSRTAVLWLLQSLTIAVLLLLLWEPAISITALRPQQNLVAVVLDNSRSMNLNDTGEIREHQAVDLLKSRLLPDLTKRFQVRLYTLNAGVQRVQHLDGLSATASATQIGTGLRQLADEAATLPMGAVVLLSDGADNSRGIDAQTMAELHRRRLAVNTIGFGSEKLSNDVELERLEVPAHTLAGSRLEAQVTIRQRGFSGKRATLVVTGDGRVFASRQIELTNAPEQTETVEFNAAKPGVMNVEAKLEPLAGEENVANNRRTRVLAVDGGKRRILYVEGEPRWEYKFLRRAVEDDPAIEVVSMLRTTQNK